METKFAKMEVERAPFLTERLGVRVLPCVIAFVKGVGVDRVVGFEGLGGSGDGFETGGLERRLVGMGVLREEVGGGGGGGLGGGVNRGGGGESGGGGGEEEDGDDEWD